MADDRTQLTELLNRAAGGDAGADEQAFAEVYAQLRGLAAAQRCRLRPGDTLDSSALVHELYLRLHRKENEGWAGRTHFFCTAARSMRDLLVEEARRKGTRKRGGDRERVDLDELEATIGASPEAVLDLHAALEKLEKEDERDYTIVSLRYFTGLKVEEIAEILGVTTRTVERRWRFCRSWLALELGAKNTAPG